MNLWEQGRTGLLANHPNWGKFVGGVTLVTSGRMLTTFYTVGLTFHVTDTNIEVSTDNPPLFQSADDFLRTLDAMKMFYRLGKANKDDVERAARAYQAKVWSDCDRIGRKRPAMKLSNLVVVR